MEYPRYIYPVSALFTGASFGNLFVFARLDEESNLKGLWSAGDNQYYCGSWDITVTAGGSPVPARETSFFPESQTTSGEAGGVIVEKQFLVPFVLEENARGHEREMRSAIYLIRLRNMLSGPVNAVIRHAIHFAAVQSVKFIKQPLPDQMEKLVGVTPREGYCEVTTVGRPDEARVIGSDRPWRKCEFDQRELHLDYEITLKAGEHITVPFVMTIAHEGLPGAYEGFRRCLDVRAEPEESIREYKSLLSRSLVMSPDPVINRGLQWAKVNTVRVQHRYRIGEGFTNDPPQDIIVVRDLAWYTLGADYLTPHFSSSLLALAEKYAFHENGKLTEYIHANEDPPEQHDYHLNINDDTPLYVIALLHHATACRTDMSLPKAYPLMRRACDYILSQIRDGLVRCDGAGVGVWGICGWRNIIDNYTLNGAVTEINAECYHALQCTAEAAELLNEERDAEKYAAAAALLRTAIDDQLRSNVTGLYLLNLDREGNEHHDLTGDLIFPVMFDVAQGAMREKILEELTDDDMWTTCGSRTVSKFESNYDPDRGYQLVGGLWHNLTAWIAYCIRRENPSKLVEGMRNIFMYCEMPRPKDFQNVVPGQFPERLHGESYVSRGMAMSPWMPPTYLWLGIEGLMGVKPNAELLEIAPAIPENWKWVAVKNLLWRGKTISAFLYGGILYATSDVTSSFPVKIGTPIETWSENEALFSIGMRTGEEMLIFVSADKDAEGTVGISNEFTYERRISLLAGEAVLLRTSGLEVESSSSVNSREG